MKMKQYKKIIKNIGAMCIITFLTAPLSVFAGGTSGHGSNSASGVIKIDNPLVGQNNILTILATILNDIILPIGVTVSVVFIIYAGFLYVTAQGSVDKIQKAHQTFLWTAVGAGVLLGAWTISQTIQLTLCQIATIPGICN